jgi:heterodisulfide reductase subunit B
MKYAYNPGCTLLSTGKAYDISLRTVCQSLSIELVDFDNGCCGTSLMAAATPYGSTLLCSMNMIKAKEKDLAMVLPCSGCYKNHKLAARQIKSDKVKEVASKIGAPIPEVIPDLLSTLDILSKSEVLEQIETLSANKLSPLKVACYYGCQLSKPRFISQFDNPEHPDTMDTILQKTGAETVKWGYKTECCGSNLTLSRSDIVESRVNEIMENARQFEAHMIVTCCPICQHNLEQRATENPLPVLYFTELLALALGSENAVTALKYHLRSPIPALKNAGIV